MIERPVLIWVAMRLPGRVGPDHLTLLGVVGAFVAAAGYAGSHWSLQWLWLAIAGLILNWAGDSLDGTLARLRQVERPRYGFFVDHVSDLFSQSAIFLGLGCTPGVRFGIACVGLIAYLLAFAYTLIYCQARGVFRITYLGFGPTEIRALLIIGNLVALKYGVVRVSAFAPGSAFGSLTLYELAVLLVSLFAVAMLLTLAWRELRRLDRDDPRPA
ncbi:MAG TPA: CDP-alcohol phosphatidyltransferase family protein [Steroidobacteraceae bacterium]|nr:CDP-alcohol phosphatidyltransferase family protein [Steroidobacteraceae bacterium]